MKGRVLSLHDGFHMDIAEGSVPPKAAVESESGNEPDGGWEDEVGTHRAGLLVQPTRWTEILHLNIMLNEDLAPDLPTEMG